jgi:hypothetical protein
VPARRYLEAKARFEGETHDVHTRVGGHDEAVYIDLGDDSWRAVKITAEGWEIVAEPPVKFRRPALKPLPAPVAGGTVAELRRFINVETNADWILIASWLVAALLPRGPYPLLVLHGEQGSAKSTATRLLRELIDPSPAPTRSLPSDARVLAVAARNSRVLAFDNLSSLSAEVSDALCRLATGSGFATRKLYTDEAEMTFWDQRPIILNGITALANRGDLLSRSIVVSLPRIDENRRLDEATLYAAFEDARPRIIGALCDAVATALRRLPETRLDAMPRMADFARAAAATAPALGWAEADFVSAYTDNRSAAIGAELEASSVATAVIRLLDGEREFRGTATELLDKLNIWGDEFQRTPGWPKIPSRLSGDLRRVAPALRQSGLEIERERDSDGTRLLVIRRADAAPEPSI